MPRAATELAKDWRHGPQLAPAGSHDDRRRSRTTCCCVSGTGDVIQPTDGVAAIGSGGAYALAAARALMRAFDA